MPDCRADQRKASHDEEDCRNKYIRLGTVGEGMTARIKVESNRKDQYQAQSVGPDVDCLVGKVEGGTGTIELGFREAIALLDVRIVAPWRRKVIIADQASLLGECDGAQSPRGLPGNLRQ